MSVGSGHLQIAPGLIPSGSGKYSTEANHTYSLGARCSDMSDSATSLTIARQAPLSMEFSRQEYWSGLPFPSPGDLPNPGIKTASLVSLALADRYFYHCATWETQCSLHICIDRISPD